MSDLVLTEKRGLTAGPEMIAATLTRQRSNFLRLLAKLDADAWAAPSRCSAWSVHDVVGHVINVAELHVGLLGGGQDMERFLRHGPFSPATTPALWLADSPRQSPEATVQTLADLVDREQELFSARMAGPDGPLMPAPSGRLLHWSTRTLHMMWDAWIHERDVALALGLEPESRVEDFPLVTMYGLLLAGGVGVIGGQPPATVLALRDAAVSRYEIGVVDDDVFVAAGVDAEPDGHGDTAEVLDSLTGREPDLLRALTAPEPVIRSLGVLRHVM
ncbi:maleylpyruvate isomerase family mycothiol-dependent enzyme [Micromonospora sp. WMMD882]|uniref:maleylpyruvate isomerase family mycothiol-dependent enzyme n=1 Tax=Micromonospora sp. WMMD882 TaxID=3015151 RepID=UPI00248B976E|nr:maleylpyruvate isomerase family mycothiol-dependent enzyme [Micromonospora sp. WMMD882]WBB81053.1 maleylpyruvate isomerase family mycothiol-dependent enzyme [Micromonospora sp. WMMD882]